MNENDEAAFLTQMLTDAPHVENKEIKAALEAGLTIADVEWNQRLERPWTFHPSDAKAEEALRVDYYVRNGVDQATAKEIVSKAS